MPDDEKQARKDVAVLGLPNPDGSVPAVRFGPDGPVPGVLTLATEGSNAAGRELVHLTPGNGPFFEIETLYDGAKGGPGKGPAMVNSDVYRSGWDAVFAKRGEAALN